MSSSLNLYATKVFSEQPIALWALDDTTDYISILSSSDQNLSTWSVSGATVVNAKTDSSFISDRPPREPFESLYVSGINESEESSGVFSFSSNVILQPSDFNIDLGSFAMGAYFFTYDRIVDVRMGYSYTDTNTSEEIEVIRNTIVPAERQWASVSQTFAIPENFSDLRFIIEVSFTESETPYQIAINGINIGQWAEEFHLESAGVIPSALPSNIDINSNAVPALSYGFDGARGYYLSSDKKLYAKNSGLPLVYGAFNSTVISPNPNKPSLILPGFGFLNESGRYKSLTFEFWAKIQSNTFNARKIFGSIASDDGLYVQGPFLKLRVGRNSGSHYVGEWDRPMLIDIRLTAQSASLILNGDIVITFDIDGEDTYPEKFDTENNDQDWLGFYAYEDVPIIQIDCAGIYPYEVPAIVAKRRWVYGQAVEIPNNIRGLDSSTTVFMDNSFAKSSKNYSYPLVGRWKSGFVENILPGVQDLSFPDYQLPSIVFNNKNEEDWYDAISEISSTEYESVTLKPNPSWENTDGYLLFESLNVLLEENKCFYGVFSVDSFSSGRQSLFDLVNDKTGNSFSIFLENDTVNYSLKTKQRDGSVSEEILYSASEHVSNAIFLAGIHIPRFISSVGNKAAAFFGSKQDIKVFVGGTKNFSNTFKHKIYSLGFCTRNNLKKIEDEFLLTGVPVNFSENYTEIIVYDGGSPDQTIYDLSVDAGSPSTSSFSFTADGNGPGILLATELVSHISSYTLVPKRELGNLRVDIGADSYWEDYVPMSYFGKYVPDGEYKPYKTVDFLQFNIDYPRFNNFLNGQYTSAGSPVKIYATFQFLNEGANKAIGSFTNTQPLGISGVVRPGSDWQSTKYEITDDTIIYPPAGVSTDSISINFHIQIISDSIFSNPIRIRSLKISSQSLGFSPNRIGNRFGAELFPYRKVGNYFDYKSVSPFSIYKNVSPYFYLASNSGIRIRDQFATSDNRGLTIPINKNLARFFKVGSFQMAIRYDEDSFPETPVQIFEIEESSKIVRFYLVAYPGNSSRGYIYAINNNTGSLENGIIYNIDGRVVKRPTLNSRSWAVLGFSFGESLDMSQGVGALRITNPVLVDNISYYQITEEDEAERFAFRKWYAVRSEPDNPLDWDYWDESTWQEVLFLTENEPRIIDPSKIYKQYTGTDRVILESDSSLSVGQYRYSFFKNLRWSRQILDSA